MNVVQPWTGWIAGAGIQRRRLLAAAIAVAAIALLYASTLRQMAAVWSASQTFAHCYAIAPVCAWMVWRQRASLPRLAGAGNAYGLLALAMLGLAWLLADTAGVPVVMAYAVLLMLPATLLATLGWPLLRALAYPCAYLLLAVPAGDSLIPLLIDFTSDFTVAALHMSGIPVFRENNFITLPSGAWAVADACSGLRYVMASLALGALYAYLYFPSPGSRAGFIAAAALLPVLANGVRAYAIVMLGHLSGMRLAVGVDHLLYGWLFFGIVCLLLYWCAAAWGNAANSSAPRRPPPAIKPRDSGAMPYAVACIAIAAIAPLAAWWLQTSSPSVSPASALRIATSTVPGWQATLPQATPVRWAGAPQLYTQGFRRSGAAEAVTLQLAWYPRRQSGPGMLDSVAAIPAWRELGGAGRTVDTAGRHLALREQRWHDGVGTVLVWRWYRQSGVDTGSPWRVKWLLARNRLLNQPDGSAEVAISIRSEDDTAARATLQAFLDAMLPAIDEGLRHADHR